MTAAADERARWLAKHVLPYEAALRNWLRAEQLQGVDLDDVVQETYAVLAGLASVQDIRNPGTYAFQVAHSIVLQQLRRARIVSIETVADWERLSHRDEQPSPEREIVARDELQHIMTEVNALPPRCREVFLLRKVHGLSQREIARRLGIAEGTVEKQMQKGLALLMRRVGRSGASHARAPVEETWSEPHEHARIERRSR